MDMVAFIFLWFPQKSQSMSREKPLPDKFFGGIFIFTLQGLAETYRQISLSYRLHKLSLLSVIAVLVPECVFR
jgi:hypothetical protein